MLYIAMSMGHPGFGLLSHQSIMGMFKNIPPSIAFFALGIAPTLTGTLVHHLGSVSGVLLAADAIALFNVLLIIMGYLFAREVFEVQNRNVPALSRISVAATRTEGQLAR